MSTIDLSKPNRDTTLLAPFFQNRLLLALNEAHDLGYPIAIFEAYRSPDRQQYLWEQGRTRPGKKVTFARAGESAHQLCVASDLAFWDGRKWSWDGPWEKVHSVFENFGFETLDFEKAHVQILGGLTMREANKIAKDQSMLALWNVIEMRLKKQGS